MYVVNLVNTFAVLVMKSMRYNIAKYQTSVKYYESIMKYAVSYEDMNMIVNF